MTSNLSFDSLNGDDFYNTFQTTHTPELLNRDSNFQAEAVEQINLCNNLELDFDSNDFNTQVVSEYFTEEQFISNCSPSGKDFSMLHLNIRSANKNFDSFRNLIEGLNFNCSVIGLTETWFSDHTPPLFSLPNYDLIVNNRLEKMVVE